MRLYPFACVCFLAAQAAFAAAARAAEPAQPEIRVAVSRLPEAEVRARLRTAAETVCKAEYDGLDYRADPIDRQAFGICLGDAFGRALASVEASRRRPVPAVAGAAAAPLAASKAPAR